MVLSATFGLAGTKMKLCVRVCWEEFVRGWDEPDDRNVFSDKSRREKDLKEVLTLVCVDWCGLAGFRFMPLLTFVMATIHTITAPYKYPRVLALGANQLCPAFDHRSVIASSMATITPPQCPSSRDAVLHLVPELLNGERQFGFPTPPTGHDLMKMWPTLAPQIPHAPGSSFFHSQERAFFSRDNSFFQVQINIDPPQTDQAMGGPYSRGKGKARADPPQLSAIPRQQLPQPPLEQPSPLLFLLERLSSIPTSVTKRASEDTVPTPADKATPFTDDSNQPSSCRRWPAK